MAALEDSKRALAPQPPAEAPIGLIKEDSIKSARQAALRRLADKHVLTKQEEQKQDDRSSQARASVAREHDDDTVWDPKVAADLRAKDG